MCKCGTIIHYELYIYNCNKARHIKSLRIYYKTFCTDQRWSYEPKTLLLHSINVISILNFQYVVNIYPTSTQYRLRLHTAYQLWLYETSCYVGPRYIVLRIDCNLGLSVNHVGACARDVNTFSVFADSIWWIAEHPKLAQIPLPLPVSLGFRFRNGRKPIK